MNELHQDSQDTGAESASNKRVKMPFVLQLTAWMFLLAGAYAVIEMMMSLTQGRIWINLNVLIAVIGFGLYRLKSGWRYTAIVVLAIGIIATIIACAAAVMKHEPLELHNWGGHLVGYTPTKPVLLMAVSAMLLQCFLLVTMFMPSVRRIFRLSKEEKEQVDRTMNPWVAIPLILVIVVSVVERQYCFSLAEGYHVWRMTELPTYGQPLPSLERWEGEAEFQSSSRGREEATCSDIYDFYLTATLEGETVAQTHYILELAHAPVGEYDDYTELVHARIVEEPEPLDSGYAIRCWFQWTSGGEYHLHAFLVTTQWDSSQNIASWPLTYDGSSCAVGGIITLDCPTLSTKIHSYDDWDDSVADLTYWEFHAIGVVDLPLPVGMFAGSIQPVGWDFKMAPRSGPYTPLEFAVSEGDHAQDHGRFESITDENAVNRPEGIELPN